MSKLTVCFLIDSAPAYDDALHFELRDMNNVEPIDHLGE